MTINRIKTEQTFSERRIRVTLLRVTGKKQEEKLLHSHEWLNIS